MDNEKIKRLTKEIRENTVEIDREVGGVEPPPPPPPPPPLQPVIKDMVWAGLGFVPWVMRMSWDPKTEAAAFEKIDETMLGIREQRYSQIDSILCVRDGSFANAYLVKYQPWKEVDGKADFGSWNNRWWYLYDKYCGRLANLGMEPSDKIMSKYLKYYFQGGNNINGVTGRFTEGAKEVMVALWRKLIDVHFKYWGPGKEWICIDIELDHKMYGISNRYETGFMIAKWMKEVYEGFMGKLPNDYDVRRIVCNDTKSSFVYANMVEEHSAFGYEWGDNRCLQTVKGRPRKRVVCLETNTHSTIHNYAMVKNGQVITNIPFTHQDYRCAYKTYLKNGKWQSESRRHEDAGAGAWKDENGNWINYGKGFQLGNSRYQVADIPQTLEASLFAWEWADYYNKPVTLCHFPLSALKLISVGSKKRYEESYLKKDLDMERSGMPTKAHNTIYSS